MVFYYLPTVIILTIFLNHVIKRNSRNQAKLREDFLKQESTANATRKKSLEHLDYIIIPLDQLPFQKTADNALLEYQAAIKSLSDQKIVNLTGISNTDLKTSYGASNLPLLSSYDENFTQLARNLYLWGKRLYESGFIGEAIQVLEYGVDCQTDISAHYTLLANIYNRSGRNEEVQILISKAERLNSLMKNSIIKLLKKSN